MITENSVSHIDQWEIKFRWSFFPPFAESQAYKKEENFDKAQKDLKSKLDEVEAKMAAADKQKNVDEEALVEKKGDESFAAQEFEKAITYYSLAQDMCQSSNMPEKILGLENKIIKAQAMLNPATQSVPAAQSAPATQSASPTPSPPASPGDAADLSTN